jgi:NAD(P)-dependent dehydrogenase (short-subunit alcohol dehydrogenase family)
MSTETYRRLFDLSGKTALVTGGSGILGSAFCRALAEFGAAVAVVDIDEPAAHELASALREETGARALALVCDVAVPASVARMTERVVAELGGVHVLVNNAASKTVDRTAFFQPIESFALSTWRDVMSVNLDGMFNVAQAVGARMIAQGGGGSIVQIASIYGALAPDPRIYEGSEYLGLAISTPAVYTASKAGVIGLTRHLATAWGPHAIRVNTLSPGGVESGQNETFRSRYAARVPLGRMARRDDMVGAVLYLASDAARYVTGQNLMVDGGLSAW